MESSVVVPVDPLEGGQFDVVEAEPGSAASDQLGLEQPDVGFGQRVVQSVADGADAGCGAGSGQALGEGNGGVLGGFNRSAHTFTVLEGCGGQAGPAGA